MGQMHDVQSKLKVLHERLSREIILLVDQYAIDRQVIIEESDEEEEREHLPIEDCYVIMSSGPKRATKYLIWVGGKDNECLWTSRISEASRWYDYNTAKKILKPIKKSPNRIVEIHHLGS